MADTPLHRLTEHTWAWPGGNGCWGHGNSAIIADGAEGLLVDARFDRRHAETVLAAVTETLPEVHIGHWAPTGAAAHHHGGHAALGEAEPQVSRALATEIIRRSDPATLAALLAGTDPDSPLGRLLHRTFDGVELSADPPFVPAGSFEHRTVVKIGTLPVDLIDIDTETVVWLPGEDVLCAGDLLSPGLHPARWSGSMMGWHAACAQLVALRPSVVLPGHGPVTDIAGIIDFRDYLGHLIEETRRRHDRGMPAEQAALDLPLRHWADWAGRENLAVTVTRLYHEFEDRPEPDRAGTLTLAAEIAAGMRAAPRIPPLAPGDRDRTTQDRLSLTNGETAIFEEHRANIPNIITTLVRHPALYEQSVPIGRGVVTGLLPGRDREMVILRGAWNTVAPYQWSHHRPMALTAGLSELEVDQLSQPIAEGTWSPRDRALLTALDELHEHSSVTDPTWRLLEEHYDQAELIELITLAGEYRKISFQVNSWRVQLEGWAGPYRLPTGWRHQN